MVVCALAVEMRCFECRMSIRSICLLPTTPCPEECVLTDAVQLAVAQHPDSIPHLLLELLDCVPTTRRLLARGCLTRPHPLTLALIIVPDNTHTYSTVAPKTHLARPRVICALQVAWLPAQVATRKPRCAAAYRATCKSLAAQQPSRTGCRLTRMACRSWRTPGPVPA